MAYIFNMNERHKTFTNNNNNNPSFSFFSFFFKIIIIMLKGDLKKVTLPPPPPLTKRNADQSNFQISGPKKNKTFPRTPPPLRLFSGWLFSFRWVLQRPFRNVIKYNAQIFVVSRYNLFLLPDTNTTCLSIFRMRIAYMPCCM